ncbi:Ima1-N domain-containing protein [Fusarium falciforme]|uniref:Ima1-N domain-containing protein n=1 Tax=Fusarium falciforme TaxID=195108 RepID=UPI0023000A47|nr:Ima1-N domain-containing protein [Fusarium falciforme]WAO83013.1 Ima1-N domain-containing protein [Fusarium falciforme]
MPRLRGTRYLSCFYCGKRSNTKYDGVTSQFLCLFCDATNYLDENGEITDPPVATEREAPATQYAVPRQSPPSSPRDSIFCSTCLKNQRLFTSSLAQYLPDDPNHPDYPELERNYYRYRKGLEERYPQVCDECAERVEGQIRRAGYTAKTDHLRRMMEKSRGRRADPGRNTALDWANSLGRGLWWGGLAMQMLWHIKTLSYVLEHPDEGMYDPDDRSWPTMAVAALSWAVAFLPPADTLMSGAVTASILSAWWNPQFVQVSRGFTRHLLGFTQWYSFQGLIIFFRILFRRVLEMNGGRGQSRSAQLSAHLVMAVVMIMIYSFARRSIRVDTTPLFGNSSATISPKPKITRRKKEEPKTFSELLNEALDSPTPAPQQRDLFSQPLVNPLPRPYPPSNPVRMPESPHTQFNSLNLSPQRNQEVQYSDEMDWTPTESPVPSQHRAFREAPLSNGPRPAFGESPVSNEQSPFWYKVPAAPTTPSQRLRNPPNAPVLRGKPVEQESIFFRGAAKAQAQRQQEDERDVSFKPPSFFAPQRSNDEANSLADMLSQSFSLSQESQPGDASARRPSGWTEEKPAVAIGLKMDKLGVEFTALAALLVVWGLTLAVHTPFRREVQLALLSAAGTIALRVTGEASKETKEEKGPSTATYVGSVLSVMELAAVCWLGWEVWQGTVGAGKYGIGVLTVMLGHQVWSSVV